MAGTFDFKQVFPVADVILNVVYDAFGKKQSTETGKNYPDYQAEIQTEDDIKKQNTNKLLITTGLIIGAGALIYLIKRK